MVRTDCTSFHGECKACDFVVKRTNTFLATPASLVAVFRQSRPVTLLKLARERGNKHRQIVGDVDGLACFRKVYIVMNTYHKNAFVSQ